MSTVIRKLVVSIVSLFFLNVSVLAQYEDFRIWTSADLRKSFGDVSLNLELGQRLKENATANERSLATLSFRYKLNSEISLETGYRYQLVSDTERELEAKHRIHGDFRYKYTLGDFSVKFRERLQYGLERDKLYNRVRLGLSYDIFSFEILGRAHTQKNWTPKPN